MNDVQLPHLGLGIGWRPELAVAIDRRSDLGFIELVAESLDDRAVPPDAIACLQERGVRVVLHGLTLSLGGAARPDARQLNRLARLAELYQTPTISEHIAFVRAGGVESGHLLPLPRTWAALETLVENIRIAQAALPVPLALENISSLVEWPGAEMDEATFLTEVIRRTNAWLLLDLENVYANSLNHNFDAIECLQRIPLDRIAYVHVAGGAPVDGVFHDTHAHDVSAEILTLLTWLYGQAFVPGVMLERDDHFPSDTGINQELDRIAAAVGRGKCLRLDALRGDTKEAIHVP